MHSTSQIDLLARLMDVAHLRNEIIAHNLANINTPGQQCLSVQFEDALGQAMGSGQIDQALQVTPRVVPGGGGAPRADGNNVDIDLEMARLDKNSVLYELYAQVLAMQLGQQRSAIQGH